MDERNVKSRREVLKTVGTLVAGATAVSLLTKSEASAEKKAPRLAMVIDLRKCVGCYSCQVSCKMENSVPMGNFNAWVLTLDKGEYPKAKRVFLPKLCNHCEGKEGEKVPPCIKVCPEYPKPGRKEFTTPDGKKIRYQFGATYKRPDGITMMDNELCIGCGKCIKDCPYGVRYFNPYIKLTRKDREADFGVGKCDFCQHRIDKGLEPACVRNCVGRARYFGDLNDPNSEVSKLLKAHRTEILLPDEKIRPHIFYVGLDKDIAALKDETNPKPVIVEKPKPKPKPKPKT